jgi:uncharacterized hydrophobic protein (TIGR00271 family)
MSDADRAEPNDVSEAISNSARERLGVTAWDRPAIYRESAEAGTDNGLPYWTVLLLSGAIATLGLAMNSSAVVIGAMLVAPLLAPVLGLALALAVGDGRLSVQTAAIVLGSTIGVIAVSAALTTVLPFHTVTLEISARTRPTTLDLAIAVFSGLVGAVVTVARRSRLSAAIPGVAIAVALIPPLAVTGFGVGIGRADLVTGSLLLYGANLAGIVLSGMAVFLLIGMARPEVVATAREWHRTAHFHGVTAWTQRVPWVRSLDVFQSPPARVTLVFAFVFALGLPLTRTLAQIARETRVERAIADTQRALFDIPGRASVLNQRTVFETNQIRVYVRVATTEWFGSRAREEFERSASAAAGEPVRLTLEQLPARGEDLDQLRSLFPPEEPRAPPPPAVPAGLEELLVSMRARLSAAAEDLVLPTGVDVVQTEIAVTDAGRVDVGLVYAAQDTLAPQAEEMLHAQLGRVLGLPDFELRLSHLSLAPRTLGLADEDPTLEEAAQLLLAYPALYADISAPGGSDAPEVRTAIERLRAAGIPADKLTGSNGDTAGVQLRFRVRPARG